MNIVKLQRKKKSCPMLGTSVTKYSMEYILKAKTWEYRIINLLVWILVGMKAES